MHQIQLLTIVRHLEPGGLVRGLPAPAGGRGAPDRLGHLRGRDRRRHGPLDRGGHPRRGRADELREAGADRQLRRLRRRPAHDAAARAGGRARRPGGRRSPTPISTRSSRPAPGTCWACAARARRDRRPRPVRRRAGARRRPFARVAAESMVPISHILWSHLWLGIAEDAFERARAFVKAAAKRTPGSHAARRPAPVARSRASWRCCAAWSARACATSRRAPRGRPASSCRR